MRKKMLILTGMLALMFLSVCAWKYARESTATVAEPKKQLPVVSAVAAASGSISRTIELEGTVAPVRIARLSSPVEGPIGLCSVREGDLVTKGREIICIGRNETVNAFLSAAKADLVKEKDELERVIKLVENGAIPGDQIEIARSRYEKASAEVVKAEQSRKDHWITAPFSGIISKVMAKEGDYVPPRTPLIEMFDPAGLVVRFSVPETDSQSVEEGKKLIITLDAYPGKTFEAKITRVYPTLDQSTRTRLIEASLLENISLMPGLFARVSMAMDTVNNAVIVPSEAVLVQANGDHVAYVLENGKAVLRKVETGIEANGSIAVIHGVRKGEQVVVAGNEKLKNGTEVRLMEEKGDLKDKRQETGPATTPLGSASR